MITKSTNEKAGRLTHLGTVAKTWPAAVSAAQLDSSDSAKQAQVDSKLKANRAAIREPTAQTLMKHLSQVVKPPDSMTPGNPCSPTSCPSLPLAETAGQSELPSLLCVSPSWTSGHWLSVKDDVGKQNEVIGEGLTVTNTAEKPPTQVSYPKATSLVKRNTQWCAFLVMIDTVCFFGKRCMVLCY